MLLQALGPRVGMAVRSAASSTESNNCDDDDGECKTSISREAASRMAYAFAGISIDSSETTAISWGEYRPLQV